MTINHQTDVVSTNCKMSYDHSEVAESGVKPDQLSQERVILTEQDESFDLPRKYEACILITVS
jgi:hypothetical protein